MLTGVVQVVLVEVAMLGNLGEVSGTWGRGLLAAPFGVLHLGVSDKGV